MAISSGKAKLNELEQKTDKIQAIRNSETLPERQIFGPLHTKNHYTVELA